MMNSTKNLHNSKLILEMNKSADHAGIQNIQTIFQQYAHRLYHWAENRDVPAENNYSERGFRRLVISRKISFGSQSDKGAKTREILMILLKKYPPEAFIKQKHQYMEVIIFIYAIFSYTRNLREGFRD